MVLKLIHRKEKRGNATVTIASLQDALLLHNLL
jgi:hypothetical protein